MDEGAAGHALQGAALTLVAHRVDCERVVDLTDPMALSAIGITLEMLGSPWEDLSTRGLSPPTWGLAKQLIQAGHHGILVPSFAPGTGEGDRNLVLWRWPAAAPCRVLVIGDFGRLPKADGWLQPFDRSTKEQPVSHLAGHPGRLKMAIGSGLTGSSSS